MEQQENGIMKVPSDAAGQWKGKEEERGHGDHPI